MPLSNPFPVSGYHGDEYFCDRESELIYLREHIKGHIPIVIIGVRRLGKTGLIRHLFAHQRQRGVFVDVQGTESVAGLTSRLAQGIYAAFSQKKHRAIWEAILSLRPTVSIDPVSGAPQFGVRTQSPEQSRQTIHELFVLLTKQRSKVTLAFDEFQEVLKYDDANIEALLRAEMQQFPQLNFIFSGSQTHLITQMFQDGNRPFYASSGKLFLQPIERSVYADFIAQHFSRGKKSIAPKNIEHILEWTDGHTFYTQFLCNRIYGLPIRKISQSHIEKVKWTLLETSKQDFYLIRDLLPAGQWKLLVAIAKEHRLYQPYSKRIVRHYDLTTPAAVKQALNVLLDKQVVNQFFDSEGVKYYKLADVFLMRFVRRHF